jgi:hypothetical protein
MFTTIKKLRNAGLFTAIVLSFIISSCQKDDFSTLKDPVWSPELAIPLVNSSLTINDLVHADQTGTTILVDSNQFATLIYEGQAMEVYASSLVDIPESSTDISISLNSSEILALNSVGQISIPISLEFNLFDGQGIEIDSILFRSGNIRLRMVSNIPGNMELNFDIPDLTSGNTIETGILNTTPQTGINGTLISLQGKKADLTKSSTGSNSISVSGTLTISDLQSPATAPCNVGILTAIENGEYSAIFGYFGSNTFLYPRDTISISIFENSINSGSFTIAEPSVEFSMNNSLGIPLRITLPEASAQTNSSLYPVSGIPNPVPVQSPSITEIGQTRTTGFSLDHQNSNISNLISDQPRFIFTQAQMMANPGGVNKNFVTDSGKLSVNMKVKLPLYGTANNFRIRDTLPFSYDDLENVEWLEFKAVVENGFPLESSVQILFTNDNFDILDSLFSPDEIVIASGLIDPVTERVVLPAIKKTVSKLDRSRLLNLMNATHLIIQSKASTTDNGNNVKLFADYTLDLKISTRAKLIIQ